MQLRQCIIAHNGPAGHHIQYSTLRIFRNSYFMSTMSTDIRTIVWACLHCISITGWGRVARPLGSPLYGSEAKDLLQFDYIELGLSLDGAKYVLI